MKPAKLPMTTMCGAVLIALAVLAVAPTPAQAEPNWARLRSVDFPARVKAIEFRSDFIMDERNAGRWGAWRVSFGSEPPVATWSCDYACPNINISYLDCYNAVVGTRKCSIQLSKPLEANYLDCQLNIWKEGSTAALNRIGINCPKNLRLE